MMGRILLISLVVVCLAGCKDPVDLSGSWIEADNFKNPTLVHFSSDQYWQSPDIFGDTLSYQITSGKIMFSNGYNRKFSLSNDRMKLLDNDSDSIIALYERLSGTWFLDHLISKLNLNINLPDAEGTRFNLNWNTNILYLSKDSTNNITFVFNGEQLALDTTLYLSFARSVSYPEPGNGVESSVLVSDKNILMKDIKLLIYELRKARLNHLIYITKRNDGGRSLFGIQRKLPALNEDELNLFPDSMQNIYPPAPPPFYSHSKFTNEHTILCEILNDSLLVEGKHYDLDGYQQLLKDQITTDDKFILVTYIDDNSTYNTYLSFRHITHNTYYLLRNEYTLLKHSVSYNKSPSDIKRLARKKIPMRIAEISHDERTRFGRNAI